MDKRLLDIFDKVKSKEMTFLYDRTINFEDLFVKDENGITLLEHALKNKISIATEFKKSLGVYPEIVYMFLKYGDFISSLNVTEQSLFTEVDGKLLIQHIIDKDQLYSISMGDFALHLEIIDLLIENGKLYYLSKLNSAFLDKLFTLESDGTFKIEKYVDSDGFQQLVGAVTNPLIIGVCKKHNKTKLLEEVNTSLLMKENADGLTYLEVLNNEGIELNNLKNVPSDVEFIRLLIDLKMYDKLVTIDEDSMFINVSENQTVLDYLIQNNLITKFNFSVGTISTIQTLVKYNRLDVIDKVDRKFLLKNMSEILSDYTGLDMPLYQYLIERGYKDIFQAYFEKDISIVKYLVANNLNDLLVQDTSESFLEEVKPGVLLIDYMVDNNIKFKTYSKVDSKVCEHLFNKGRLDYLAMMPVEKLVELSYEGKSYFEYVIEAIGQKKIKGSISDLVDSQYDLSKKARLYISVANLGLLGHLDRIDDKVLLRKYNDKTFLEYLLDVNPNVTVDKIIRKDDITNMEIVFILKQRGIDTPGYDTPLINETGYNLDYLNHEQASMGIGPLLSEGDELLRRLEELFKSDGKSEKHLIDALIAGYREALVTNYDLGVSELANLVKCKEEHMDEFFYLSTDDGAFFRPMSKSVYCSDKIITTLLHETGHALHYFLTETKVPDNYSEVLQSARENVVNIRAVESFANEYHEIRDRIMSEVDQKYDAYFRDYYNDDRRKEIEEFLNESKETKRIEYKNLGVSDDVIDIIISKAFTVDEYIEHQKRVFKEEYVEAILRSEHNVMMVIGDILDAIFGGELHSNELLNENGEKIKSTCGHGIAYYGSYSHGFDEMIANFATLVKGRTAVEDLRRLKELVGDEVFAMISDFYYTNISKSEALDLGEGPRL